MMTFTRVTRVALAGAAAAVLSLGANAALAQPNKCQAALEKVGPKFAAAVAKNVQKCADGVRKLVDKPAPVTADGCNKAITKINDTKTATLAKCLTISKCTAADLVLIGQLAGTVNAPGAGLLDFTCASILERAQNDGINEILAANPSAQAEIGLAAQAAPGSATDTFFQTNPTCAHHACSLDTSSANVTLKSATLGTLPLTASGVVSLDFCALGSIANTLLIAGTNAKTLAPTNLGGPVVCSTTVNAVGYCDCGLVAKAPGYNYTLCRDSDSTDGEECVTTGTFVLSDDPGSTSNGPLYATYSGSSVTNGCAGVLSTAFKTVLPGQQGTDGVYCTPDDTAPVLPATGVPFTTGTTQATINDGANTDGNTISNSPTGGLLLSSCANARASVLTGTKFAASAIAMDGGSTGDSVIQLGLQCQ